MSTTRAEPTAGTRTATDLARADFDAIAATDVEALSAVLHAEAVYEFVPVGIFRGRAEIRGYFEGMFAAMSELDLHVVRVVGDDDVAYGEWRLAATLDRAPFMGIEPTGKRIELRGVDCFEAEDGLIRRNTVYYDGASFARAIGMLPPLDSAVDKAMITGFNAVTKLRARVGR